MVSLDYLIISKENAIILVLDLLILDLIDLGHEGQHLVDVGDEGQNLVYLGHEGQCQVDRSVPDASLMFQIQITVT